jgi:hypothetical protein
MLPMGLFTRDRDPRPKVDESAVAHSLLYFLWRDDVIENDKNKVLVMTYVPSNRETVLREMFCMKFIAAMLGVTVGMANTSARGRVLSILQIIQLGMTGDRTDENAYSVARLEDELRISFTRYITSRVGADLEWSAAVARTQSYVPPFAVLKQRLDEAMPILQKHAPNAQAAFEEIADNFCSRVGVTGDQNVRLEAFAYLCTWKNAVETLMPTFRWK